MPNNPLPKILSRVSVAHRWLAVGGAVAVIGGIFGYRLLIPQPKVISPSGPSLGTTVVSNTKPVRIVFSHPVKTPALKYQIHPALKGAWSLDTNWVSAQSTLTFTPSQSPDLGTRYTIELSGIQSILGGQPKKYLLSFQTDPLPNLLTISPFPQSIDVLPDYPIIVTFDAPVTDSVVISISSTPAIVFDAPKISGKTVTFPHAAQWQKSTSYLVAATLSTVKRDYATSTTTVSQAPTDIGSTTFTTIAAPTVHNYAPGGSNVDPASAIRLEFKQAMDRESTQAALTIAPAVTGTFSWESDVLMVWTPNQPLAKGQTYTVTLANTAKATSGFSPDENFSWTFTTLGTVTVLKSNPANGATGIDVNASLAITFNQAVDHPSAESKYSMAPNTAGSFAWSDNTMTFDPSAPLAYNVTYTATVEAGVKTISGLDSSAAFSTKFATRNQSVMLNVPAYRQAHVYSCMIAAARSAMAFRGKSLSESAIIAEVGRDTTPWSGTWGGDNGGWGDPDAAIVGPLDNAAATSPQGKKTTNVYWGYGSHWGPISRAMTAFGVGNEVKRSMTVQELAQSITNGNPVIVWWVNGIWPSYEVNWTTPAGKSIRGVNGLHVQVVRGFTGPVDNPISFTVTDSGYGYPGRTYDVGTFKAKWGWFGNTGIVVK